MKRDCQSSHLTEGNLFSSPMSSLSTSSPPPPLPPSCFYFNSKKNIVENKKDIICLLYILLIFQSSKKILPFVQNVKLVILVTTYKDSMDSLMHLLH